MKGNRPTSTHGTRRPVSRVKGKKATGPKPYTMHHMFISVGLTNDVNIKWLADYCGTSVAMVEKHYGKYIRDDADEQLARLVGARTETLGETVEEKTGRRETQAVERIREKVGGPTWTRTRDQPVMSRWL
jgi:hypothetical protein